MTLSKTKPGGWTYAEVLTSTQVSAIDANIENAVDKRTGHSDTVASDLTFNGNVYLDGYTTLDGNMFMNGGKIIGKVAFQTKAVTGSTYTVDTTTHDYIIFVDSTSNAVTINLPAASNGRVLIIKSVGPSATNNITLHRNGSDTIEVLASDYVMDADYQSVTLAAYSGGSWFIIATA